MVVKIGTFGNDLLLGGSGADTLQGSFGDDTLRGLNGNDVLAGGGDDDTLEGGNGNDSLYGDAGDDHLDGGAGIDTAVFDTAGDVDVSLEDGIAESNLGDDTLAWVENLTTGDGDDTIWGNNTGNVLRAGGGDDYVAGQGGNDVLNGGEGWDTLEGGAGNDILYGDGQGDVLDGGAGINTAVYDTVFDVHFNNEDNIAYLEIPDSEGADILHFIDNVTTGDGDDYVQFSATEGDANVIQTNGGNDRVLAYGGNDVIDAGAGNDEIDAGSGNDIVHGGSGNDELLGAAGHDTINGGSNADLLWGHTGVDALTGGSGADDFAFRAGDSGVGAGNRDEITDFVHGQDDLDLTEFGGLAFIGQDGFSAVNQARFSYSGGNTIVSVNTAGNSGAELQIELAGIVDLTAGDFLL